MGTLVLVFLVILFATLNIRNSRRRVRLSNFMLLMIMLPDEFEKARNDFFRWLGSTPPEWKEAGLWWGANKAIETSAKRWTSRILIPGEIVARLVFEARDREMTQGSE